MTFKAEFTIAPPIPLDSSNLIISYDGNQIADIPVSFVNGRATVDLERVNTASWGSGINAELQTVIEGVPKITQLPADSIDKLITRQNPLVSYSAIDIDSTTAEVLATTSTDEIVEFYYRADGVTSWTFGGSTVSGKQHNRIVNSLIAGGLYDFQVAVQNSTWVSDVMSLKLPDPVVVPESGIDLDSIRFEGIDIDEPRLLFDIENPVNCVISVNTGSGWAVLGNTGVYPSHNYRFITKSNFVFEYDTTYQVRIQPEGRQEVITSFKTREDPTVVEPPVTGDTMTYAQIRAAAIAKYPNIQHDFKSSSHDEYHDRHLAAFIELDENLRYWNQNTGAETISKQASPTVPSDALDLPAPSGGDDTSALRNFVAANSGREFDGKNRTYRLGNWTMSDACVIHNLKFVPTNDIVFKVNTSNVEMHGAEVLFGSRRTMTRVWELSANADNFHLTGSKCNDWAGNNTSSTRDGNFSAVWFRGDCKNYHIVGNEFMNLTQDSVGVKSDRSNAFLYNGGSQFDGGMIANNRIENLQSNGKLDDSEPFTMQNATGPAASNKIKYLANRHVNAGKRMIKVQHDAKNIVAFSNYYEWKDRQGDIGARKMLTIIALQQRAGDCTLAHNRFVIGAEARYDSLVTLANTTSGTANDNVVFENNDIVFTVRPPETYYATILLHKNPRYRDQVGNVFARNTLRGAGSINYLYEFNEYNKNTWDIAGNDVQVPILIREFK